MRRVVAALVVGGFLSGLAMPALASRLDEAKAAVDATLVRLKVDPTRIKSVYLAPDDHPNDGPVPSYTGWISFTDCRGNLVIDLTQTATIRSLYTTGNCVVPGVD